MARTARFLKFGPSRTRRPFGLRKKAFGQMKRLTQFGHVFKSQGRASLRSDNCPNIPEHCPKWIGTGVRIRRNPQSMRVTPSIGRHKGHFRAKVTYEPPSDVVPTAVVWDLHPSAFGKQIEPSNSTESLRACVAGEDILFRSDNRRQNSGCIIFWSSQRCNAQLVCFRQYLFCALFQFSMLTKRL